MEWGTKYRLSITGCVHFGLAAQVDIQQDGYAGAVTDLIGTGADPFLLTHDTAGDDVYNPINGSYLVMNIIEETDFQFAELYTTNARAWKVVLTVDSVTKFVGYILPDIFQLQYKQVPNVISITASDQLGYLRGIEYTAMTQYAVRTPQQMLELILARTDLDLNLREAINVYENRMDSTSADSPIDQCYIDQENYIENEETGEMKSCYDVLLDLLRKYSAIIRQVNGEWRIWRPSEASASYNRRLWTWNSTTKTFSYTSTASFNPVKSTTSSVGSPLIRVMPNGNLSILQPWKQYTINERYGLRENFVRNNEFDNWISDTIPRYWSISSGVASSVSRSGEKCVISAQTVFSVADLIFQSFDNITENSDQRLRLRLRLSSYVPTGLTMTFRVAVYVRDTTYTTIYRYWDFDTNTWSASASYLELSFTTAPYQTIEVEADSDDLNILGIAVDQLTIAIYQPVCSNVNAKIIVDYAELQLIKVTDEYEDDKSTLVTINDDNNYNSGAIELLTIDVPQAITAHNPKYLYKGGIYLDTDMLTPTQLWSDPDATGSKSLVQLIQEKLGYQYQDTTEMIGCDILTSQIDGDSTIREINNSNKQYMVNRDTWNIKHGVHSVEMTELKSQADFGFLLKEDGDYLLQEDGYKFII